MQEKPTRSLLRARSKTQEGQAPSCPLSKFCCRAPVWTAREAPLSDWFAFRFSDAIQVLLLDALRKKTSHAAACLCF